jgi:hypothetical protein
MLRRTIFSKPTESSQYANLLGIENNAKHAQLENEYKRAQEILRQIQEEANIVSRGFEEIRANHDQQIANAKERIRTRVRNIYSGHGQPSNANQLEHYKTGMRRTWNADRSKYNTGIYKRLENTKKYVERLGEQLKYSQTQKNKRSTANNNLLTFPSREEELAPLFSNMGNQLRNANAGAGAGGGGGGAGLLGGRRKRTRRRTLKSRRRSSKNN